MRMSKYKRAVEDLLDRSGSGIVLDGPNPWDPQVHNEGLYARIIAHGTLGLGEAYMDGWWDCDALDQLFERALSVKAAGHLRPSLDALLLRLSAWLRNRQHKRRVWRAAEVHYNLGDDIFEATFDSRLTGSCAYWRNAAYLDGAQEAKLDLICRKIGLRPGQRVLDIGCGWGAFMGYAAEKYGAECVGITVSSDQVDYASRRYGHLPVEFRLQDYRDFDGRVDHVVSMGMFEHVGEKNYRTYFKAARRAIRDAGLFLLHTITANIRERTIDPWLDKYIFPNGVIPTPGQVARAVEGLFVIEDVHNFGPDYDKTLMAWNGKFQSNRVSLVRKYGERFCRMWQYYLLCCAAGFRSRTISVCQFMLSPRGVPGGYETVR